MRKWSRIRGGTRRRPFAGRSTLRRFEWGSAGRHRRRNRRALAAVAVLAATGIGIGVWFAFFRGGGAPHPVAKPGPKCATARLHGTLGRLAWVGNGTLHVFDLDRCKRRVLVAKGAAPPVRFSPDGRWIAFGSGGVVPSSGGRPTHPLGDVASWAWSVSRDRLAGVTTSGRVMVGGPTGATTTVLQHGAQSVAWSPKGDQLAVGVGDRAVTLAPDGSGRQTIYVGAKKDTVEVVGWSPGGNWVLFFQRSKGKASAPLDAAPASGAGYHNVFDPVLPYADFLSWCGSTLALSGGGDHALSEGQQLLTSAPPLWRTRNLAANFTTSWIWPACSPDGTRIAVTLTPNQVERPPGEGRRSLWVVGASGQPRRRLAFGDAKAFEAPRWSADGRFVMAIERGLPTASPGRVVLILVDAKTMKPSKTVGPIAVIPPAPGELGHERWTAVSDWYRPPAHA